MRPLLSLRTTYSQAMKQRHIPSMHLMKVQQRLALQGSKLTSMIRDSIFMIWKREDKLALNDIMSGCIVIESK